MPYSNLKWTKQVIDGHSKLTVQGKPFPSVLGPAMCLLPAPTYKIGITTVEDLIGPPRKYYLENSSANYDFYISTVSVVSMLAN